MSTKKAAEKATVCAGCEKRDATIKRQAEECGTALNEATNWRGAYSQVCVERDTLQARIDSFIKTCADIRAVCVDAGIEHADKMATLTAVKALAENAKAMKMIHDGVAELLACVTEAPRTMKISLHHNGVKWETVDAAPPATERKSVMPLVILALNLAILGRLLTM